MLSVIHTANAGVLIRSGNTAVGADIFCRDPDKLYPDTPAGLRAELLEEIRDRKINALFITHEHADHFNRSDVEMALKADPSLRIISTEKVIGDLAAACPDAGKLYEIPASEKGVVKLTFPGLSFEIFNSPHEGAEYAGIQNLSCLILLGGKQILISGDAALTAEFFARAGAACAEPDLMIVPFPAVGLKSARKRLLASLHPKNILAVHLPREEADEQHWTESARRVSAQADDGFPPVVFAEDSGAEYRF